MKPPQQTENSATRQAIEIAIRLGIVFLILAWCLQIISPFISLVAWGGIIAISIYNPFLQLLRKLGGHKKLAATLIAVFGVAIILVPVILLSPSAIDSASSIGAQVSSGKVHIAPPAESVREWPLIGEKTYAFWQQASTDLGALLEKYPDLLARVGKRLLGIAKGVGVGILFFIIAMLIAAAFLSSAAAVEVGMRKLARRLAGDDGDDLLLLSTTTVGSVAVGVIGIAFIQAVLGGLGMMVVAVPGAGLLALVILVIVIAQLPALLVLGPVIFYIFSVKSLTVAVIFMIWSIAVSLSDVALKPLLLGRGVDAPIMVILLGAVGGMLTSGIVGLFIGAVVLAVGYKLFQRWVDEGNPAPTPR